MNADLTDISQNLSHTSFDTLSKLEQHIIRRIAKGVHISRNTNREFDEQRTFGQRLADRVAAFGGSWPFIMIFCGFLIAWMLLNSLILVERRASFDPFPYILLNLILSMLAALQAPVIMMSQNRQAAKDRLDASHDYEVNLKAELEILDLQEKLDGLCDKQLAELVTLQQEQIRLMKQLLHERGVLSYATSDGVEET
jgi:uncharacterized membrane protein